MKLSENTINVLKNYAAINNNLFIAKDSNELKTWTVSKNIYAKSTIEETLPFDLPIYDLGELLSVIDIFKSDAEIDFGEYSLVVGNGKSKVSYQYSDPSMLSYPTKNINIPDSKVTFELSKEDIKSILNISSKLSAPDVSIKNINNKIVITVYDIKTDSGNAYTIEVADYTDDFNFDIHLKADNLKVIFKDYTVSLFASGAPLVHFKSKDDKNEYFIAVEKTTKVD